MDLFLPHWRSTVLSFKGLFFNLAYGAMGFFYAAMYNRQAPGTINDMFSRSLSLFLGYFAVGFIFLLCFALWRQQTITPNWWLINKDTEKRDDGQLKKI